MFKPMGADYEGDFVCLIIILHGFVVVTRENQSNNSSNEMNSEENGGYSFQYQ